MNDFTKEELKHIADAIFYSIGILDSRKETLIPLREKIQSMIDNYCEHETDGYCYDDNGESVIGYQLHKYTQQKCKKCGALFI